MRATVDTVDTAEMWPGKHALYEHRFSRPTTTTIRKYHDNQPEPKRKQVYVRVVGNLVLSKTFL